MKELRYEVFRRRAVTRCATAQTRLRLGTAEKQGRIVDFC
jgi:hypothetical protein